MRFALFLCLCGVLFAWRREDEGDGFSRPSVTEIDEDEYLNRGHLLTASDALNTKSIPHGEEDEGFLEVAGDLDQPFNWLAQGNNRQCLLEKAGDQSRFCASCYAFAAVSSLDYRLCSALKSRGFKQLGGDKDNVGPRSSGAKLATQIGISCAAAGNCQDGGSPADVIDYIQKNSITTQQCVAYTSWSTVRDTGDKLAKGRCPAPGTCPAGPDNTRGNRVTIVNAGYVVGRDAMKRAIRSGGPIAAVMKVPATFPTFPGGTRVFSSNGAPQIDSVHAFHIVTIFGWGVSSDQRPYWVALNSWGSVYNKMPEGGVTLNDESGTGKGAFVRLAMDDAGLGIETFPAYWMTPGVRVGGKSEPVSTTSQWKN